MLNKNFISGIVVLMAIALAGITIVQYYWIRNAIRIKQQQFDQAVSKVLSEVTERIEKDRDFLFVSDYVWPDQPQTTITYTIHDSLQWTYKDHPADSTLVDERSVTGGGIKKINLGARNTGAVLSFESLKNDTLRYKTILRLDSVRDELQDDQFIVMTAMEDTLDVIVKKTLSRVRQKKATMNEAIDEMVIELKSIEEPLDQTLSQEQIFKRLGQELRDEGIELSFEFAVYDPVNDSLTNLRSKEFAMDTDKIYKARLFPASVFDRPELLLLSFPGKSAHILESMAWLLTGSVLFTLVIILTFFITIRVIMRQKKLSEIKSDFINNMTHEFKTPIATISLAVDSINNPAVITQPERIRYFTGIINEENMRMNSRVENVLQMSLIDSKDFHLHPEMINIDEIIDEALKTLDLQVRKKNATVTVDLQAKNPIIVADKAHLLGIMTNLLDNSLKYSSGLPEIRIETRDAGNNLMISVTDSGIGLAKEEQTRIFDKFYRIPSGDIHNVKGFGLGLSYVKAIIQAMKGEIEVKSQPGKGSSFIMRLPREKEATK